MPEPTTEATSREIVLKHDTQYWVVPDCTKPLHLEAPRGGRLKAGTKVIIGPARRLYTDSPVRAVPFVHEKQGVLPSPSGPTYARTLSATD